MSRLNPLYLNELGLKTKRGTVGRVKAGRVPCGRCYGYDALGHGKRRIFREYVFGSSALQIAGKLNAEGIKAPRGAQWNASTINGSRKRQNGILNNTLYVARITFNRQQFRKDSGGRRQARPNPKSEWITSEKPELRIVEDDVWNTAHAVRETRCSPQLSKRRRPKHLLSGLVECGCGGSTMIVIRDDREGCSANRNKRTRANNRTIRLQALKNERWLP